MENIQREWLEKAISNEQINYIKYNKFTDPILIGIGSFGKVFKYEWRDNELMVALKCLKIDSSIDEETIKDFINKLKLLRNVCHHPNIIMFYGVTKDSNEYYNILQYANEGTLREYLKANFTKLQWSDKQRIASEIACGLLFLHDNNIIHENLHSKNILIHQRKPKIADFGRSKMINKTPITSNSIVNGMPAYIEPKRLINHMYKCDRGSDIYSIGVILWEISSGKPPFQHLRNEKIIVHVSQGNREEPIEGTPSQYIKLYKKCWDNDPANRPEIKLVFNTLNEFILNETLSQHHPIKVLSENSQISSSHQDYTITFMNSLETIPRGSDELMQVEIVQRKVKVLLNKLTLEKFDSISDQIIDYANKSKFEKDGCILKEVIRLIFEQFCDEPSFSKMYAQLCRKIMETIDPEIVDKNVTNSEGKFVQGATLFRKYLLNRCQKDFEKNSKESNLVPSIEKGELDLMSDEYFTVAEAKQYRNGLIRFIGEIFKLNMITERIMHECIKKMLNCQNEVFDEEELEGLCKLMMTAGQQLDHIKSKSHMNVYFRRMENISKSSKLSNRIKFMLIDVINLRNNNWVPRCDKSMSSYGSSGQSVSSDDWNRIGGIKSVSQQSGDLAKFGSISHSMVSSRQAGDLAKFGSMSHSKVPSSQFSLTPGGTISVSQTRDFSKFGSVSRSKVPSSQFSLTLGGATFADLTGGSKGWKTTKSEDHKDKNESMSLTNSMSNTYGNLVHFESTETRKLDKLDSSSVGESKKSFPLSSKRKKIVLAPRTAPLTENLSTPKSVLADFSTNSIPAIFKKVTERNINNIVEGYFDIFDMNEVILFIKEQPKEFYSKVIEIFANKALEKKQDDVDKVIMLFNKLTIDNILDKSIFIGGFTATIEFLIDIGIDSPKSYTFTGQLFCAARLDSKDVSDLLKPLSKIDDKGLEKVMAGFKDEFGQLRSVVRRLLSVTNL